MFAPNEIDSRVFLRAVAVFIWYLKYYILSTTYYFLLWLKTAPFLVVSLHSNLASGKAGFHLGKEAVPRHRLLALLGKGEFDRALELARAHSMDETDVHAARLLGLLREGGAAIIAAAGAVSYCPCNWL